ncbi:exocyst complex component 1 isoform X2 [Hetaerina americana]|uniref:exocyst complex component 1 isoform X2 n=1 Tax=Hetaerina americana TaxID=62018 RepID=UPI003A7F4474
MATIRHALQREVFKPCEESLLSFVNVSKLLKKKKTSFLCITSTNQKPTTIHIHQVKKTDKNTFKKKNTWTIAELISVDGKTASEDNHEFDVQFEKTYRWYAISLQERKNFLLMLWKLCCKHLPKQKPPFRNLPEDWTASVNPLIDLGSPTSSAGLNVTQTSATVGGEGVVSEEADDVDDAGDYRSLTEKEQADLEKMVSQYEFAISNADAFMEVLARDLSILDGENVHSVLATEDIFSGSEKGESKRWLLTGSGGPLDEAIEETDKIEKRLEDYEQSLAGVRRAIQEVEQKNALIELADRNARSLLAELENVVNQLDLYHHHQNALMEADLSQPRGLEDALLASEALRAALNAQIHPALVRLGAVQGQRRRLEKLKGKFSQNLSRHLNNLFIHLGNDTAETFSPPIEEIFTRPWPQGSSAHVPPKHHAQLAPYGPLLGWARAMDRRAYAALARIYSSSLGKLYERDLRRLFEEARSQASDSPIGGPGASSGVAGSASSGTEKKTSAATPGHMSAGGGPLLGSDRETWAGDGSSAAHGSSGGGVTDRRRFDEVLDRALAALEPVCLSEQKFCVRFFHLDVATPDNDKNTQTTLDAPSSEALEDVSSSPNPLPLPQKRAEKLMNEEVRKMMGELFASLEQELISFVAHYEKVDSFYCMSVLVRLGQHVMSAQDAGSFLTVTFGTALVHAKRSFDRLMQAQLRSIQEARPPGGGASAMRRSSNRTTGILPFVANFEDFAKTAESIFKGSERRADLDKWYTKLVGAMFEAIPRTALEQHRTPAEVVKMENFHHLYALLSQLKIAVLDTLRKDAKQKYSEALKAYVTQYFGRPLEKLNQFFEGVQAKVSQGVKESEISFQMAFSKQELRRVIREYPAREVKRGLESLYRKVEKHLCEEENLLQVVWRAMQEEFIQQYKSIEELIQRCYPGSMITLDFTISDILEFFSEIARSH